LLPGTIVNYEHLGRSVWTGAALVLFDLALHLWGEMLWRLLPQRADTP